MRAKLRLVPLQRRDEHVVATGTEERFRYPAEEEPWEVSCDQDGCIDETPDRGLVVEAPARSRRAS